MKKEFLVLFVVIAALSVYLFTRGTDRVHYELPNPPELSAEKITKIDISGPKGDFSLKRQDDGWVLGEKAFKADNTRMENILKAVSGLTLTALVSDLDSEAKSYVRYNLDPEKQISVKAYEKTQLVREFDMGKAAASFRHTFVRLAGDDRVYHARDNFRDDFEHDLDGFRDKNILSVKKNDIRTISLTIKKEGHEKKIEYRQIEKPAAGTGDNKDTEDSETVSEASEDKVADPAKEKEVSWERLDGEMTDTDKLDRALSTIADLDCGSYIEDEAKADFTDPETRITLAAGNKTYTLSIFPKGDSDNYPAVSSESGYPFYLTAWRVENMIENLEQAPEKPPGEPNDTTSPGEEKTRS